MSDKGKKIGLALSGGGYRAAAYHIGTMRALHKLGILDRVDVISSVSGGSITAAYYALNKDKGYNSFEKVFTEKLRHSILWVTALEVLAVLGIIFTLILISPNGCGWYTLVVCSFLLFFAWYYILPVSKFIEWEYDRLFFKKAKLDSLPKAPILAINSTDLSSGNQFTFSQDRMTCYAYKNHLRFDTIGFPVGRAVMASSCIPQLFSPIKIGKKYCEGEYAKKPLLVDGGLYDNQGAHKFDSSDSHFAVDYAIVSDAGNSKISSKWCVNPIGTLVMTSEILMKRIKNFQRQHNSYIPDYKKKVLYAYNDLTWNDYTTLPNRFIQNIKDGFITKEVLDAHGITDEMLGRLKDSETSVDAFNEILELVKSNIGWKQLMQRIPQNHSIAMKVCTNLIGLNEREINALIEHSEWLTEVQVRLHLPFLVK